MSERCTDPTCIACQARSSFTCNATEHRIRADERRLLERWVEARARDQRAELAQARALLASAVERLSKDKPTADDLSSLRRAVSRLDSLLEGSERRQAA